MNKLEIIEDTAKYYIEKPERRSIAPAWGCSYNGENGNHCAVGRFLKMKYRKDEDFVPNQCPVDELAKELSVNNIDDCLVLKVKGHSVRFWIDLQDFHDKRAYWDEDGITKEGKRRLKQLKKKYS